MTIIKNGTVYTMESEPIPDGAVVIQGNKIAAVCGRNEMPQAGRDDQVLDACGGLILPGLIDPHSHLGITEDSVGDPGNDCNETPNPITPAISALDGINPNDPAFLDAVKAGITTVMSGPGSSNVVGGQFVLLKTSGTVVEDMIVKAPAAMKAAFGENPKRNFMEKDASPATRMANAFLLRNEIMKAKQYQEEKEQKEKRQEPFLKNLQYESWLPVLRREIPLKAHAHRADDIMTAVRIAKEFDLKLTIDHCTEGHLIAGRLEAEDVPVIIGPGLQGRNKTELSALSLKTPGILEKHNILFALTTDHPVTPIYLLPIYAGFAVKEGLSLEGALQAVTVNAARICGAEDRIGRIRKGHDADIAVFDGNPMLPLTKTLYTMINGEVVYKWN